MAKYKGIVKIQGKIDDLSFYEQNGQAVVKRAGGVSKEKIMNDQSFQRTRENMAEFGGSATVAKAMRDGLAQVLRTMGGNFAAGRTTALIRRVVAAGTGSRGQRSFSIVANKAMLEGFSFSGDTVFSAIFNAPFTYVANAGRTQVTLTVPDFNTRDFVNAPQGATHFKLVNAIAVLSNYSTNGQSGKYEPTDPALNQKNGIASSALIPIGGMVGAVTTVVASLPGTPTMTVTVGLISCVGIEFYQMVGTTPYLLASNNAMRLQNVF